MFTIIMFMILFLMIVDLAITWHLRRELNKHDERLAEQIKSTTRVRRNAGNDTTKSK